MHSALVRKFQMDGELSHSIRHLSAEKRFDAIAHTPQIPNAAIVE
jgi:hypothetical protein